MNAPIKSNDEQIEFWNGDAGKRWVAHNLRLDTMIAPIGEAALKLAAAKPGEHVLDVGCGCGATSLALADSVGSSGRVVGADISEPMLAYAKSRAASKPQLSFTQADAAAHRFEASFDLLFSRFGIMFFADADAAFANLRRSLKPGGRLAFACWRDPRENEWVTVTTSAARDHLPPQPQLGPEDPGPFAFANPGRVRRILANAGFDEITMRPFDCPLIVGNSLDDALDYVQQFGPLSRMLTTATPPQREAAINAVRQALVPFAKSPPVRFAGATWLVTAKCA